MAPGMRPVYVAESEVEPDLDALEESDPLLEFDVLDEFEDDRVESFEP